MTVHCMRKELKVGLQTITWDDCPSGLDAMFKEVRAAGFDGVELAQLVADSDVDLLVRSLDANSLQLAGVSGGSLLDRLNLVDQYVQRKPKVAVPYVYVDDWTDAENVLFIQADIRCQIAIHPHMFKPIQTATEAIRLLKQYAYCRFMPDTGHLTVAGADVQSVIRQNLEQTISIHLKDWSPEFGRSLPFYSRGFVPLGKGIVPIREIIQLLLAKRYNGWLIVEQDYSLRPISAAQESREFLRKQGI